MKKLYHNLTSLIVILLCFGMPVIAQQSLNVTFNDDDSNNWAAYGDTYVVEDGHLYCNMALQSNSSYRGDLKFNNGNNSDINFTLDPAEDVYLAIKFIGSRPNGSLKMEFNDGTQWFNKKWNGGKPSSIETVGGNYIYYFLLSSDDNYIGNSINVRRMNFTIADAKEEPYSYKVDWIATFKTLEDIEAYKNAEDDGEEDLDEYVMPTVFNQTTNVGYASLNEAVSASEEGDVIVLNKDVVITNRINVAVPITIIACEDGASITRGYTNGLILLTQTGGDITIGGTGGNLILDGASLTTASSFIESGNGATTIINNNVTIKNCQSTNLNGSAICNKSNSQLILNGVTFENCKTLNSEGTIISDRGVVFIGSALTLEGDNKFVNCNGADIFLERNTIIKAENANHLETINIIIEDPSTRTAKDVVLNYIDENRIQLMNSGYKLISNDKDLQFSLSTDMFNTSNEDDIHIAVSDGYIIINSATSQIISIYSINGAKILETSLQSGNNKIDKLPKGIYFINKKKIVL